MLRRIFKWISKAPQSHDVVTSNDVHYRLMERFRKECAEGELKTMFRMALNGAHSSMFIKKRRSILLKKDHNRHCGKNAHLEQFKATNVHLFRSIDILYAD